MNIHEELIIKPYKCGVVLNKPPSSFTQGFVQNDNTVSNILKLPMNIYFMNSASVILTANETTAETCGFISLKSAIGSKITRAAKKESAQFSLRHDKTVMAIHSIKIAEENFIRRIDEMPMQFISIRLPWYDTSNPDKILGIFGFTISSNIHGLAKSLALIVQTGLIQADATQYLGGQIVGNIYLSAQESKCFNLLARRFTTFNIAKELRLPSRTIEHYIENIMIKLDVRSRQDLIHVAMQYCR